jgi:hypothetical protein
MTTNFLPRAVVTLGALCAALALAQAPVKEPERPWALGVPKEQQTIALDLFRDGNNKLRDALYRAARDKYVDALKAWDHPAIHYNLSLTLMNLDQPVEAYEHLLMALKYGSAPLDAEKMDQALRYKGLVEKQLTHLSVRCALEGAVVRLDGNQLFVGPGAWEGMVRAGPHAIVASREGYVPAERAEPLLGGAQRDVELTLFRTEDLTEYRRLWPAAVPWAVTAAGVAFLGAGVALHLSARADYASYDRQISSCAVASGGGCLARSDVTALKARGDLLQPLAIAGYIVGGAALVTGSVLIYLNRLQPYVRSAEVVGPTVSLLPSFGPGGAGATLVVSY